MKNLEQASVNIISGLTYGIVVTGEKLVRRIFLFGGAHSCKVALNEANLPYAIKPHFNLTDPNERRLPWDFVAANLWIENRR